MTFLQKQVVPLYLPVNSPLLLGAEPAHSYPVSEPRVHDWTNVRDDLFLQRNQMLLSFHAQGARPHGSGFRQVGAPAAGQVIAAKFVIVLRVELFVSSELLGSAIVPASPAVGG